MAVSLCHGTQETTKIAHEIMSLYGEKFEDYIKEFDHA
jgi:hypothetical protein